MVSGKKLFIGKYNLKTLTKKKDKSGEVLDFGKTSKFIEMSH